MYINNKCSWIEWFSVPNMLLELHTGLTRQAIVKSRDVLKQYGLIDFRTNGTKATEYKMNTMLNSLQDSLQVSCQDSLQDGLQDGLQDSCTLIKLNKTQTKLNIKEKKNKKENVDAFVNIYSHECNALPQIRTLTNSRIKAIGDFLKTYTLKDWEEECKIANSCNFLLGENDRGWKADFDFLIKVNNATKVLEGKYSKGTSKKQDITNSNTSNPFLRYLIEEEKQCGEEGNSNGTSDNENIVPEVLPDHAVR